MTGAVAVEAFLVAEALVVPGEWRMIWRFFFWMAMVWGSTVVSGPTRSGLQDE